MKMLDVIDNKTSKFLNEIKSKYGISLDAVGKSIEFVEANTDRNEYDYPFIRLELPFYISYTCKGRQADRRVIYNHNVWLPLETNELAIKQFEDSCKGTIMYFESLISYSEKSKRGLLNDLEYRVYNIKH